MRVLIVSLDSYGYIYPLRCLHGQLADAGHITGLVGSCSAVREFDRECSWKSLVDDPSVFHVRYWGKPETVSAQFDLVVKACGEFRPDVVLASDLAFGVRLASMHLDIPHVTMGSAAWLYSEVGPVDGVPAGLVDQLRRTQDFLRRASLEILVSGASAVGVSVKDQSWPFVGERVLIRSVPSLCADTLPADDPPVLVGALMPEFSGVRRQDDRIIVALSRSFGNSRLLLDLIGELVASGAFQVDIVPGRWEGDAGRLLGLPANVQVVQRPSPDVFANYTCAVLAGNSWQTLCALRAGLPLVIRPFGGEQPVNAIRLAIAGRAVAVMEGRVTVDDVTRATSGDTALRERVVAELRKLARTHFVDAITSGW